jgi:thiol-disulfide isomerase/thioredoxin
VLPLVAGTVCAALLSGCAATSTGAGDGVGLTLFSSAAHPAVDVRGTTLTGARIGLASLHGHVVVVNVWASWCRPCRQESRVMAAAARRFATDGVVFVGLDERDSASAARRFASAADAHYPQLADSTGRLLARLPLLPQAGIPSTLVLDRSGRPAARIIGPASRAALTKAVRAALDNR